MYSTLAHHRLESFFFFNDTATTEIYTLSLHDALPIFRWGPNVVYAFHGTSSRADPEPEPASAQPRSEEHTSELQSPDHLVCRLLLEKKKRIAKLRNEDRSSRHLAGPLVHDDIHQN